MKDRTTIGVRNRRLCLVLRRLRAKSGLSGIEVAQKLGVSSSLISRAESGKRGINRDDLSALLTIYEVERPLRNALMNLHARGTSPEMLDRGDLKIHQDLETWIGFEQDATVIHNYEALLIPGLLQTFPYAKAVIMAADLSLTEQEVEDRVNARIARQALLRISQAPQLDIVLHEAALHQRVGGVDVMRDQLGCLLEASYRSRINVRIVPAEVGGHPGMNGPFVIMDYAELPSLIHLENKVASLYLDDASDVAAYKLAFEGLLAVALPTDRSADLISKIASSMA
ncbi:MAG TPA: helix-turn-helix transcriptional regulator [Actinophytocola sp.]|jgi:transcriptional regulator with XRE-family HTH domain|uniref:helix-turn-helix domain-containing protein n=1 Tax=Actinophytocola sp. TaxID=1872138 RepID=UPI002DFC412B|nr:helix-turn-helix transcriptional regulator [Actinophytocola sp.]